METVTREHVECALRQALATFQTNERHRTCYLVAYLVAVLDLDVTLANHFLGNHKPPCD